MNVKLPMVAPVSQAVRFERTSCPLVYIVEGLYPNLYRQFREKPAS